MAIKRAGPVKTAKSIASNSSRQSMQRAVAEDHWSNSGLPQLAKIVGSIVAPTTLLTALMFYFGWSHAYWFFDYFGVNSTVLGLSTEDYLMRSIDGLFLPLTVVAATGLAVLWAVRLLQTRLVNGPRPIVTRLFIIGMGALGAILFGTGMLKVMGWATFELYPGVVPLCMAAGVLLLLYASRIHGRVTATRRKTAMRRLTPGSVAVVEWAGVFVLVSLSLFWAASDYSAAVGTWRAQGTESKLHSYANAVLYSERRLSIEAPGVREATCRDPDAAYRFRYDGLKLVQQSGNQYFFLPENWSPAEGVAILLPRSDSVRIEFATAGSAARPDTQCR